MNLSYPEQIYFFIHLSSYLFMISKYNEINLLGYYLDKSLGLGWNTSNRVTWEAPSIHNSINLGGFCFTEWSGQAKLLRVKKEMYKVCIQKEKMEKWGDRENWENLERRTLCTWRNVSSFWHVLCNVSSLPH